MTASRQIPVLSGVLRGARAFHRKYSGNITPEPLGNHANFVINFCQILFVPKPCELPQRSRP
jgi:hypothetical protein